MASIDEIVSRYVTLRPVAHLQIGFCPFCTAKQPTLQVNVERGIFRCTSCHRLGTARHFLEGIEQATEEKQRLWKANEYGRQWFEDQLWQTEEGRAVGLSYLRDVRKLTDETIRQYHIGYAPDSWDALAKDAQVAGLDAVDLKEVGLCTLSKKNTLLDMYRNRVMFVGHDVAGHVISFAGRAIRKEDAKERKYVNSPESPVFLKKQELFGIYEAVEAMKEQGFVYLVEGQLDLISMHQMGIHNVVASGGTGNVSPQNVRLLHRFVNRVVVLFDSDAAGMHGAVHAIQLFLYEGMRVRALLLPEGEDPDSFSHGRTADDYQRYFLRHQVDYITYIAQRMLTALREANNRTEAQMRAEVFHELARTIALLAYSAQRSQGIHRASELLEMPEVDILQEVNREREAQKARERQRLSVEEFRQRQAGQGMAELASLMQTDVFREPERNLMQVLTRYAEVEMPESADYAPGTTVLSYVAGLLDQDQLTFHNPLYQQIYELLKQHAQDEGFCAEQFLKSNSDPELCFAAIELMEDPYRLSQLFFRSSISQNVERAVHIPTDRDRLGYLVPRMVTELQIVHVRSWISEILQRMKRMSKSPAQSDGSTLDQMQQELTAYNQLLQSLNNRLGRVLG